MSNALDHIFCPNNCEHLNMTEWEQDAKVDGKLLPHICEKYNETLHHGMFHPSILKCNKCMKKGDK